MARDTRRERGSIRELVPGKRYEITVTIPGLPGAPQRRRAKTIRGTKRQAEKALTALQVEVDEGRVTPHADLTVLGYLQQWLADYVDLHLTPQTARRYRVIVDTHIGPALGDIPLRELTALHVQRFYTQSKTAASRKTGRPLSGTTLLQHHHVLRRALEQAVRWRLIPLNPAAAAEPPKRSRAKTAALTPEQLRLLLELAKPYTLHVPIALSVYCGLRRGEVFGLMWSDLDLDAGTLRVVRALDYTAGRAWSFKEPKTETGCREIHLAEALVGILREHQATQDAWKAALEPGAWAELGLVCCLPNGKPCADSNVNGSLTRILALRLCPECGSALLRTKAGWSCREKTGGCGKRFPGDDERMQVPALPRVRFHDLRHSCGTVAVHSGVNIKTVSQMLGHANVAFTLQTYVHPDTESMKDAAKRIGDVLG